MQTQQFYRWQDAQGRTHIASSLDDVPAPERAKATSVQLDSADAVGRYAAPSGATAARWSLDWASFGVGFGAALLCACLLRFLPGSSRWLWRIVLALGIGLLVCGAYLGLVRRAAGLEGGPLAAPSALLQDARGAVEQMNQRQKQQEEELRKIRAEGH
jgi:hypothetical protein